MSELLALAERQPDEAVGIFQELTNLCQGGKLVSEDLESHVPTILRMWQRLYNEAKPFQGDPFKVEWTVDDAYQPVRAPLEWLLDMMAFLPGESVGSALRENLQLADPLLQLFAAISILRRLEPINDRDLDPIAANHQTRHKLWTQLRELQMESLMPKRWSTPEQLAASEFVNWASHPMELGVPPEEIELAKTFSAVVEGKRRDLYLFRFREFPKPWEPSGGWMAGIAGPYRDGTQLLSPWSSFDDWEAMSPEQHFAKLFSAINGEG
ncbi:MAG TPA: hypothetical protein VFO39_13025 [Candidatus Sulfotelmatobacter sp.]|nr:hypothetical protein [Candidatus Sulfotelmatobacter sp.]